MEQIIKEHSLHLEKETITINGVTNVENFDAKLIVINLNTNSLTLRGENLNVVDLDIKNQTLLIKGQVINILYGKKLEKTPFLKRIFK